MTFGLPPSMTATQLLVVPKSMPMTLAIVLIPLLQPHSAPIRGSRNVDFIGGYRGRETDDKECSSEALTAAAGRLRHRHAAVDVQRLPSDVPSFPGCEIDAGRADIVAAAHGAQWN